MNKITLFYPSFFGFFAYMMIAFCLGIIDAVPESKNKRVDMWRCIIWPIVLLMLLAHKIGPFCIWLVKEMREAPIAIARALRVNDNPSSKKDSFTI